MLTLEHMKKKIQTEVGSHYLPIFHYFECAEPPYKKCRNTHSQS